LSVKVVIAHVAPHVTEFKIETDVTKDNQGKQRHHTYWGLWRRACVRVCVCTEMVRKWGKSKN